MKKFTFIFAALFAANMINAQIIRVGEIAGRLQVYTNNMTVGNVLYSQIDQGSQVLIKLYNLSGAYIQEYKTITINKQTASNSYDIGQLSRNYFSTDGKVCFLYHEYSGTYYLDRVVEKCQVIDEDGSVVYDITEKPFCDNTSVYNINGAYYLVIQDVSVTERSYIYALPGNGDIGQGVEFPSVPRKSSRKILQNEQVRIENADRTYTLTGQEVR